MESTREVVMHLCARDYGLWHGDKINRHELARRTDVSIAVLSRLFNNKPYRLQKKNLKLLADYFNVSTEQLIGGKRIEGLPEVPSILKNHAVTYPLQENNSGITISNQSPEFNAVRDPIVYIEPFNTEKHVALAINYLMPFRSGAVSLWAYEGIHFYGIRFGDHLFILVSAFNNTSEPDLDVICKYMDFEHIGRVVSAAHRTGKTLFNEVAL